MPALDDVRSAVQRLSELARQREQQHSGTVREAAPNPWQRLAGMFHVDRPVSVEEMLDVRGFEENHDPS